MKKLILIGILSASFFSFGKENRHISPKDNSHSALKTMELPQSLGFEMTKKEDLQVTVVCAPTAKLHKKEKSEIVEKVNDRRKHISPKETYKNKHEQDVQYKLGKRQSKVFNYHPEPEEKQFNFLLLFIDLVCLIAFVWLIYYIVDELT